MSETPPVQPAALTPPAGHTPKHDHSLTIRIWPNVPILYPMALTALVCGLFAVTEKFTPFANGAATAAGQVAAVIFLCSFLFTLVVVTTDIVFTGALIGVFAAVIVVLAFALLNIYYHFLSDLFGWLGGFMPAANAQFYFGIFTIWAVLMIAGIIYSRFHYIKFESNEVIVVGGVMDKRRRFSTFNMKYTKEISDVFEYWLPFVRSGRLYLRFSNESEPVIIDHVMNVDKVIERLQHVSSSLQVAPEDPPTE